MQYLTIQDIIYINEQVIAGFGGTVGVRDMGLIDSAVNRPQATFDGTPLYQSLFDRAAALFHSVIFNHAFLDGNKRTAIAAAAQMLYINGYELITSQGELENFTVDAVVKRYDVPTIAAWLEKYAKIRKK